MIVPADRILIDGDTGWLVIDGIVDEAWYQALNRPCDACGGRVQMYWDHDPDLPMGKCISCIDGRHTFDLEVERSDGRLLNFGRAAIIEVLPIREWQSVLDPPTGRWLALNRVDGDRYSIQDCDGYGITTTPSNITLPSAAAPGMFAVRLKIAHP